MLWRYVADGQNRDRSDALVDFIEHAIEKLGMSVALIPHVIDTRPTAPINRNDHHFLSQIRAEIGKPDRLVLADASLRAREMKYLISRCRFFIGSRTHSTIAALSSDVPTISLSYSMKSRGINRDVLGHEDFVLPVNNLSLQSLQKMLQELIDRESEVRAALEKRIPAIKENARKNADYLAQVLERQSR
jgi:polysaccharide pyruvyl transferase WcaK-like protein